MAIKKAYVDVPDGQLHYRYSEAGSGPTLVFLHMTAASSAAYEPLMRELDGVVPTIAFDTMNYGESYRTTRKPEISYIAETFLTALTRDRKSTRLNSSHANISYAVFCLKKKEAGICIIQSMITAAT